MTRDPNAPESVERESTAALRAKIDQLTEVKTKVDMLEKTLPDKEWVNGVVTGARRSIESGVVERNEEKIDAVVADLNALASKESVDNLKVRVEAIQPPKFWQIVSAVAGLMAFVGATVWSASAQVAALDKRLAVEEVKLDAYIEMVKQQGNFIGIVLKQQAKP